LAYRIDRDIILRHLSSFTEEVFVTRSSLTAVFLGIIAFAGSTYAQPVIGTGGIVNNFSYVLPGLPNYGIAQGSIFDIFGTGLATTSAAQGVPLQKTLAGVSVSVTVNGVTTQAIPYFVTPLEISAILPSATPVGTGTITVTVGTQTSAPAPINVVETAFGILTANEGGTGTAAAFDYNNNGALVTPTSAITPGEYLILWGSGLGAVSSDETQFQPQPDATTAPIEVTIGGINAQVTYHGRSIYPGVDQINVIVPQGISGCSVSVVVTGTGGSTPINSNYVTVPVASSGRTCSDPGISPITASDWETLSSLSNVNLGLISLSKSTTTSPSTGTNTTDLASADFVRYTAAQFSASGFENYSLGSCLVITAKGTSESTPGLITTSPLNAGPQINLSGPDGALTLSPSTVLGVGFYEEPFSTTLPAIIPSTGGTFTFNNGSGGTDVGAFTATLAQNLTTPLVWTNMSSISAVTRVNGQTVTWTGGAPGSYVLISGTSISATGASNELLGIFTCAAPVSDGQFTVPPAVLESLPASTVIDGFTASALAVANGAFQTFTAPGLDLGLLSFTVTSATEVPYI
jgi:uncharacterized protein (TIGR03437 family)